MDVLRSVARRAWAPPAPPPRPFWVCDHRRGRPRGLVASSLEELRGQAAEALRLGELVTLVLEEDGTAVEAEGFLAALAPHTTLMALAPGQRWEPPRTGLFGARWEPELPRTPGSRRGEEVARVTVALSKTSPRDLVGQLRVTAAVRGLRCDLGGLGPDRVLRELLRVLSALTRAVGQSLLSLSAALRRLLDGPQAPQVTCSH
ncbi:lipid transferase CIDEB [Struthio camelus]|uniref:lipid transferase CIDEB n=1 Tax=Struthio camelus TaxID=8801 RepID=UPI00360407D0